MTFIPQRLERVVPPSGPKTAKIVVVGEAPGAQEDQQLKPFVGPAGGVLEQCMHAAGLIRSEMYLTNVVKVRPPRNDISPFYNEKSGAFTSSGHQWVEKLWEELDSINPKLVVAAGGCALSALTGRRGVLKYRGYVMDSTGPKRTVKVMPIIHPSAALRGQYIYRYIIAADLRKAKELSNRDSLDPPERQLIYNFSHVHEVLEWLEYYEQQPLVSFDIEVLHYELACIGLSSAPDIAISIPLDQRWSPSEELQIWRALQRVLGNPDSTKVAQNSIFDTQFLLTRCGIVVKGPIVDTMVGHSIMYPEMRKGLDFLVSLYCGTQPYYKDLVKFTNIKEES